MFSAKEMQKGLEKKEGRGFPFGPHFEINLVMWEGEPPGIPSVGYCNPMVVISLGLTDVTPKPFE